MPDLFGIDLASIVSDAVAAAGDVLPAVLHKRVAGVRVPEDPTTGTQPSYVAYPCRGVVTSWIVRDVEGTTVREGIREVLLLASGLAVDPAPGDRVVIEGLTLDVGPDIDRDPARATFTVRAKVRP